MQAEVYHLYHSGTAVKIDNKLFIFDYYNDQPMKSEKGSSLERGVIREESFSRIEKAYVFVSHDHHDHYNKVIFKWEDYCENIKYILADQVSLTNQLAQKENLFTIAKDQSLELEAIKVKALGSTDKGVSFLVKSDNINIFHAGDLNWWKWKKFTPKVQKKEEQDYKREVNKLKGEKIDIAFVPVDPRLEENYYLAGQYFIEEIKPELFVPIHFSNNFEVTANFAEKMLKEGLDYSKIAKINSRGEKIIY
ncbi:MBL fold metallo-hydrolase [Halanaerobium hydrogeniformans]|uniref:Metal dependent hydrolase n=1 Tax=Halanaerobium hydrogeniformans TaxID=656519 RepID=E4RMW3_HALHG|nr:MBL fold metallo-hydrolase [Halanaerobium hydrogeniformans]ADQ14180.1 putative metal dependent hydrolase [Halanaerobium hydrogeniformans]